MATLAAAPKQSRIDLRMTDRQKKQIERAAEVNGMSLSQWALDRLLSSARRDIAESQVAEMSEEAFDAFAAMLEQPAPSALHELENRRPSWEM